MKIHIEYKPEVRPIKEITLSFTENELVELRRTLRIGTGNDDKHPQSALYRMIVNAGITRET